MSFFFNFRLVLSVDISFTSINKVSQLFMLTVHASTMAQEAQMQRVLACGSIMAITCENALLKKLLIIGWMYFNFLFFIFLYLQERIWEIGRRRANQPPCRNLRRDSCSRASKERRSSKIADIHWFTECRWILQPVDSRMEDEWLDKHSRTDSWTTSEKPCRSGKNGCNFAFSVP